MKLSLLLCNIIFAPVLAQEIAVPSLRSLALDKSAELLHKELAKPQSPTMRQIILNNWQKKAGILFKEPTGSSDLYNQTIVERFEQKYAKLKKITEFDGVIVAISHDGTKCCLRGNDNSLVILDINIGQRLHTLKGPTWRIHHVALTRDNTKAISASNVAILKVWDINTGACLHTLQGHTRPVEHVTLTADNTKAISASYWDKILKVWDINTGTCLHTLQGHTGSVYDVALTTDNTKAISASWDNTLKVWDINTGACLNTLQGHSDQINNVALTSDNTKAISASYDDTIKVWDINTGACLHTLQGHKDSVRHVTLTDDNTRALSASKDGTLKVWDINTGKCLQTIDTHRRGYTLIHKNLVAQGDSLYRFEDYQSIIDAMPQPKPGSKIHHPARLIDLTKTGAAAGFAKLQALKHKNIAMGWPHRS